MTSSSTSVAAPSHLPTGPRTAGTPPAPSAPATPFTVRLGWFQLACGVITLLFGLVLAGLSLWALARAGSSMAQGKLAVFAFLAAFGTLLLLVGVAVFRSRTEVGPEGLALYRPYRRPWHISWEQAHGRIWVRTQNARETTFWTVCQVIIALDNKEVPLPAATFQGLFRKSTEKRAGDLVARIMEADPISR